MTIRTYSVKGMHCASCVAIITKKLSALDGVSKVDVNLATETARVEFSGKPLSVEALNELLGKYGFSLVEQPPQKPLHPSPPPIAAPPKSKRSSTSCFGRSGRCRSRCRWRYSFSR